ncbi:hypothetical protein OG203_01945 [Nocardia sp. NBC_01499]|uniref:hypothetical protein n=1 Tax=Nocardia sp. NBC_01499 TaxID=2903597 RepID=UPI00386711B4
MRVPRVKLGRLPRKWFPGGVWVRILVVRPYIVIGPAFAELSAREQDGELARAVVHADLLRDGAPKLVAVGSPISLLIGGLFGMLLVAAEAPMLAGLLVLAVVGVIVAAAAQLMWERRIVFRSDRKVAEVLGLPVMNTALSLSRRVRYKRRGLIGIFFSLCVPNEARRTDALSDLATESDPRHDDQSWFAEPYVGGW